MTSAQKVPGTHKAGKVMVTDNEEVAKELLTQHAESIGLDLSLVSAKDWNTSLRIACGEMAGQGLEDAKDTLSADRAEQVHKDAEKRRRQLFIGDYNKIVGTTLNADAERIFEQCYQVAISGAGPNISSGTMKTTAVAAARHGWVELADAARQENTNWIHSFHSYPATNKAAQGKGNVGDTLDTRKVQANFIVYFGGQKINAHVDVKD